MKTNNVLINQISACCHDQIIKEIPSGIFRCYNCDKEQLMIGDILNDAEKIDHTLQFTANLLRNSILYNLKARKGIKKLIKQYDGDYHFIRELNTDDRMTRSLLAILKNTRKYATKIGLTYSYDRYGLDIKGEKAYKIDDITEIKEVEVEQQESETLS